VNLCYNFYKVGFATKLFQEFNKHKGDDTALTGLSPGVLNCLLVQRWQLSFRFKHYCKRFHNKTLNHTKCHETNN